MSPQICMGKLVLGRPCPQQCPPPPPRYVAGSGPNGNGTNGVNTGASDDPFDGIQVWGRKKERGKGLGAPGKGTAKVPTPESGNVKDDPNCGFVDAMITVHNYFGGFADAVTVGALAVGAGGAEVPGCDLGSRRS
jgi:hypothetical protein